MLAVDIVQNEDINPNEELNVAKPPSLSEAIAMLRRLKLLSTTQHPELYPYLTQLQSKLVDTYLDSNISKQKSILDFFKPSA